VDYSTLPPEELVAICLRERNEPAWIEFVRRFQPLIASVVMRVGRQWGELSTQTIDDLVQETYLKLYKERSSLASNFASLHQDSVFGFVKVFTANLVHDHFRARHARKRDTSATRSLESASSGRDARKTAVSSTSVVENAVLFEQIDSCLQAIVTEPDSKRDRRIFWLYYRVGLPASEIAALSTIGLSTKGVESTLKRLSRKIRERLVANYCESVQPAQFEKGKPSRGSL